MVETFLHDVALARALREQETPKPVNALPSFPLFTLTTEQRDNGHLMALGLTATVNDIPWRHVVFKQFAADPTMAEIEVFVTGAKATLLDWLIAKSEAMVAGA